MAWKAQAAKWLARRVTASVLHRAMDPVATQRAVLRKLIAGGQHSAFGKEHRLDRVTDHTGLVQAVPLRDYEGLRPWIERIVHGERDVLWPGLPLYLCKTSGTTSGAKYIPITKESLPNHIGSAGGPAGLYRPQRQHRFRGRQDDLPARQPRVGPQKAPSPAGGSAASWPTMCPATC
jgi:hypothetical protein